MWHAIDLVDATLEVRASPQRIEGALRLVAPKTDRRFRCIRTHDPMLATRIRLCQLDESHDELHSQGQETR